MRVTGNAVIFRLVQLAWSPIAVVGYVLFVVRVILFGRSSKASATTLASLYTRWMQHELGTRPDEPAVRLMRVLPLVPNGGLRVLTAGTLLAHGMTGYLPKIYRYPYQGHPPLIHQSSARTTFYDDALARHLPGVTQLVLLGAGYDTRVYRIPEGVRCFEVDAPDTQQAKRVMLSKAGLDTADTTFVPADFMRDDWLEQLIAAGFDPGKPAIFLWEAVTMYLSREAVESTLRKIAGTADGSVVAFDYFSDSFVNDRSLFMRYARGVLNLIDEPFRFGIECDPPPAHRQVAAFLASCGLSMTEHRNFGPESDRAAALAGFAVASVPPAKPVQ